MRSPSLVTKLFVLLAALTTLPLAAVLMISDAALWSAFEAEASRIGLGRLEDARGRVEALGDQLRSLCLATASDPRLDRLEALPRLEAVRSDPNAAYLVMDWQNDLGTEVQANPLLSTLVLIPDDTDYCIDSTRGTYLKGPEATGPFTEGWDPAALTYRWTLPPYLTEVRGRLEIRLDEAVLSRHLNRDPSAGTIGLATQGGRVISHPDPSRLGAALPAADPGFSPERPLGVRLDGAPWVFFGEFRLDGLTRQLEARRLLTGALAAASLGLALLLAWGFSRRFVRPVQTLLNDIRGRAGDRAEAGDEVQLLAGAFETLRRRENQLFDHWQSGREAEAEAWILAGVEGGEPHGVPEVFPGPRFQVLLLVIDQDVDPTGHRVILQAARETFETADLAVRGVVAGSARLVLVFNHPAEGGAEPPDERHPGCRRLADEIRRVFGTTLTFCWGPVGSGVDGFRASWARARQLLEVRFLFGSGQCYGPQTEVPDGQGRPLGADLLQRFGVALESGRRDAVVAALGRIADEIRRVSGQGRVQARFALYQTAAALLSWVADSGLAVERAFGADFRPDEALAGFSTLDEAVAWLEAVSLGAVQGREAAEGPEKDHSARILAFVGEHYRSDLDVETVARQVGLSYSHVGRVFSTTTGASLMHTVHRLRVDDARHLLQNTDLSVVEIAQSVGYRNVQAFQRAFKKLTGRAPGDYRDCRKRLSEAAVTN